MLRSVLNAFVIAIVATLGAAGAALACEGPVAVCETASDGALGLIVDGKPLPVYVDATADPGVRRVAHDFALDLGRVSGTTPQVVNTLPTSGEVVIVAQLGRSALIDGWIAEGRLTPPAIANQWEAYGQIVIDNPAPGIPRALIILGSDKRGTIFGTYDLSAKIGVSPWYWWADVPVVAHKSLYLTTGTQTDKPVVQYRGIFINDEEPGFGGWSREKFGGINSAMYEHVFELILRLKGNYLWPAMWGKAFNDDDPRNYVLADEMGVIMSTSHHEPMMRAQEEWHRNQSAGVTGGKWDYVSNSENLRTFWRGGIERMLKPDGTPYESVVTMGMRGDGDEPMSEGTATALLETIVADQRQIIAEVTGRPPEMTPQVWALYKEVQDYYDHGMQVPEDVMLLFADDNWGQIRRLPKPESRDRAGGYGVYYHFDYVGGPRNYKWLNTNQIEKVWQQMNLAYVSGADRLWIVNVGDIKPMEYPISFFLDMAWDPQAMTLEALNGYPERWAAQQFGRDYAPQIAGLLTRYAQFAARRKPELIDADSFSLDNYNEFSRLVGDYTELNDAAAAVGRQLWPAQADAYYQLVAHPIEASSNLYNLYYYTALNRKLAATNPSGANLMADRAEAAFARDSDITARYHALSGGKWNHFMDQTHIGYTTWQQPPAQVMPALTRFPDAPPIGQWPRDEADAAEGSDAAVVAGPRNSGVIAIEAEHFTEAQTSKGLEWVVIPNLGRTLSAVTTMPQNAADTTPQDKVRLIYAIETPETRDITLDVVMVPTLDTTGRDGIRLGVQIDDQPVQFVSYDLEPHTPDWDRAVADNAVVLKVVFPKVRKGKHRVSLYRVTGNAVVQRLIFDLGGLLPSYLGPPETGENGF